MILTEVLTEGSPWRDESGQRIEYLAQARGGLLVEHLHCDLEENRRRIASPGRDSMRKTPRP